MIPQIGDFIAIAAITTKAAQALSSSRGSVHEHATLINVLQSLSQAMWQAEALCMEYHTSPFLEKSIFFEDPSPQERRRLELLEDVAANMSQEREACEELIGDFLDKFVSFDQAFTVPKKGLRKVKVQVKKLTW